MAEAALKQPEGLDPAEVDAIAGGPAEKAPEKTEATTEPKARAPKQEKVKEEPKTVPHEAFHEERTKRQAAERRAKELEKAQEERSAKLEERLNRLYEAREAAQTPRGPDLAKDPLSYVRSLEQRVAAQEQETQAQRQAREKEEAAQREEGNLWSNYRASGREFTKANPDFPDAYNHLLAQRVQELEIMGFDQGAIQRQLKQDEFNLAQHAFQTGNDPADILYKWAKQRGYQPGTGKLAEFPAKAAKLTSEIDRLKAAQDASETLSKGGGATATQGRITLETLYRMSDSELNDFIRRMNSKDPEGYEKLKRKLEGGN